MRKLSKIKLKGNLLNLSVLFVMTISILISILIQQNYFNQKRRVKVLIQQKIISSVFSGLNYSLYSEMIPFNEDYNINISNNHDIVIKSKLWGVFHQVNSSYKNDRLIYQKSGLYANGLKKTFNYQLFIKNNNQPISIIGNTSINGDVKLPNKKIKPIYIEGKNNTSLDSIKGNIQFSQKELPIINEILMSNLKRFISGRSFERDSVVDFLKQSEINHSFFEPTLVIKTKQTQLNKLNYKGNIIIYSKNDLTINNTCSFEDVIVIAPQITIEENYRGSGQFFSYRGLKVKQNVILDYPSTLLVLNSRDDTFIEIDSNSTINGGVFHLSKSIKSETVLASSTIINGLVYSNSKTQLESIVNGTVIVDRLFLTTSSSIYQNVLMDVKINQEPLIKEYAVLFSDSKKQQQLIKWLE